ncbi:hypothetical protein DRQ53_07385 [bacterium]|nr:MAG: hypothetical protein DRQ32_02885 [bacterium]RKZ16028.1 MAG: hypothetical protein DRQ53_07385 [bacterium]
MLFLSGLHDARWVIAFALLVFGANLALPQMRGDSIVYAAVSKNIVESGDAMRLTLNDEPYANKPPLFFWLTAAVMTLAGTGAVGAKLGALLASTALCVLLYRSTRHIFDDRMAGMLAVFVFSATVVVYRNTYHARMESLVTLFVFASLMCFLRWLQSEKMVWAIGWGVLAGLAVLTKGPVGLLPIVAAIVYLVARERDRLRGASLAALALGLVAFAGSFSWWFAVGPGMDFLRAELLDKSLLGPAREGHRWWSVYWSKLLGQDLLWMAAAVFGARKAFADERLRRPVGLLLAAAGVHLLMIHLVGEKSARYLYQFYIFSAGLSAFGILALKRFDSEHLLKIIIVLFAIGLQFTGTSPAHNHFAPLAQARALSQESGWPVVADWHAFEQLDEQAALDYYLDESTAPMTLPASYLLVRPRSDPMPQARTLFTSERLWVGVVRDAPHGPGPAEPIHQSSTASPDPEGSP